MNWIEQTFRIAPDAGSGATELLLVVVALVGIAAAVAVSSRGVGKLS